MKNLHSQFMQLAISEAWKYQFLTYPNPAVGATVVKDGEVLSIGVHKKAGLPHAEVNALKQAYLIAYPQSELKDIEDSHSIHDYLAKNHNDFFKTCQIYVTLEPCNHTGKTPACAMLLESVGIEKVYIGTLDPNKEAAGGLQRLLDAGIEVEVGIEKEKTDELLEPFVKWQKDKLVFFKIAMREDGSVDGGYITSQDSLDLVHELRTKIDLLTIGGNTVREDRPTLDTRFVQSDKNPDVLIYSNELNFDKTIPLFNIKNREVCIKNNLDILKKKNFVMIEGGLRLLKVLKDTELLDYIMLFVSSKEKKNHKFNIDSLGYKTVHSYKINQNDTLYFLKNINTIN